VISVSTLLSMAGYDLDRDLSALGVPRRQSGLVLVLHIEYSNTRPFNCFRSRELRYRYRVEVMETPVFRTFELRNDFKSVPTENRMNIERRGVYIAVSKDGKIGTFSLTHLTLVLVTSFALLGVAEFATEYLLTSRLGRIFGIKGGRMNKNYIQDSTINFSKMESGHVDVLLGLAENQEVQDTIHTEGMHSDKVKRLLREKMKELTKIDDDDADFEEDIEVFANHWTKEVRRTPKNATGRPRGSPESGLLLHESTN